MNNEANTCRKYVEPKLNEAGWDTEPYSYYEQYYFTDGKIRPKNQANREFDNYGNVVEIAQRFRGVQELREAVNQLQSLLYSA